MRLTLPFLPFPLARPRRYMAQALLLLLVPALLLAGCDRIADAEPPLRIDAVGTGTVQAFVADSTGKGLTARDGQGRIVPGLAQSWRVSDDGLSIVFRLRDARFADGDPVSATDVVQSLNRARSSRGPMMVRAMLAGVSSVSTPLENVVEVRLTTPQPELLELLASSPLAIRPGGSGRSTAGPFKIEPREDDASVKPAAGALAPVVLARNANYFAAGSVFPERVQLQPAGAEAAIARFNRGEVDVVTGGSLQGFGSARVLAKRNVLKLEKQRAGIFLLLNQRKPPLDDLRVRTALSMAVDRQALGLGLFGSPDAAAIPGLTPRSLIGYTDGPVPDWAQWPLVQRLEEARRLLAEAGFNPQTRRLKLQVAIPQSQEAERLIAQFADEWAAIGVDVALARRSPEAHAKAVGQGDFESALTMRTAAHDSPLPFLLPFGCGANRHGVCLAEADRLLASGWKATSLMERMQAMAAAERLWMNDGAAIGLVQPLGWSLVAPEISGWTPNPTGVHPLHSLQRTPARKLIK